MIELIVLGLAAYRLANLLINEDGPFDIFERLRLLVGLKPGMVEGFFPQLFSCIYCMSIYTAVLSYLIWLVSPIVTVVIAASTIVILVDGFIKGWEE